MKMRKVVFGGIAIILVVALSVWVGENASQEVANIFMLGVMAAWLAIVAVPVVALFGWIATRRTTKEIVVNVAKGSVQAIMVIIWTWQGKLPYPFIPGSYYELPDADLKQIEAAKEDE